MIFPISPKACNLSLPLGPGQPNSLRTGENSFGQHVVTTCDRLHLKRAELCCQAAALSGVYQFEFDGPVFRVT